MSYHRDARVRALTDPRRLPVAALEDGAVTICIEDADTGDTTEYTVPVVPAVCPTCHGKGTHVNPSIDSHGLTAEDFAEDPDFADDYLGGRYDVECFHCGGARIVVVLDPSKTPPKVAAYFDELERQDADMRNALARGY